MNGGGDCEDYAIAKYFALRALGVADERLAITYTRRIAGGLAHMVLLYLPIDGGEPVVLDNRRARASPIGQRSDLVPVYGLNASTVFVLTATRGLMRGRQRLNQRHHYWNDLLARRRAEASAFP